MVHPIGDGLVLEPLNGAPEPSRHWELFAKSDRDDTGKCPNALLERAVEAPRVHRLPISKYIQIEIDGEHALGPKAHVGVSEIADPPIPTHKKGRAEGIPAALISIRFVVPYDPYMKAIP